MLHEIDTPTPRQRLAANLRRLRIARHTSLSALARTTSMSKATLSGIERGQGNPTVDTLAALAEALEVPIGELLEDARSSDVLIVRNDAPLAATDAIATRLLEEVDLPFGAPLELVELALPAHHLQVQPPLPPGSRRRVLVSTGTLIVGPQDRISELTPGDYCSFPADVPHQYETPRAAARAIVLTSRPRSS